MSVLHHFSREKHCYIFAMGKSCIRRAQCSNIRLEPIRKVRVDLKLQITCSEPSSLQRYPPFIKIHVNKECL